MSSEVIAEPSRLEHNMMFSSPSPAPPGDPSAWYAPAERACAVRAGRRLCDSGAAILSGGCWRRSYFPRSLPAEAQAQTRGASARSGPRLRGRPGTAWAKRGAPQPFHPSPGRPYPPPSPLRDLYACRPP